jgi:hypothetical protein
LAAVLKVRRLLQKNRLTTLKKIMRTVFSTNELPHIWMSQSQDEGRVSGGHLYFEKETIYSYGRHFPIARILPKEKVIFLNNQSYSNTTSGHMSSVRMAIDNDYEVVGFSNPDLKGYSPGMFDYEISSLQELAEKYPRARQRKESILSEFEGIQAGMKRIIEILKIKTKISKRDKLWLNANPEETLKIAEKEIELLKRERKANQKKAAEKKAKAQEQAYIDLEKWKAYDPEITSYNLSILSPKAFLRRKNDKVQTSQGATITLRTAEILFRMIDAGKEIKGHRLDNMYVVKSINGSLEIGCHSIPKEEVYDFAKRMNWI